MQRTSFPAIVGLALILSACQRPVPPLPAAPEPTPVAAEVKTTPLPTMDEQEVMSALAAQGEQALGGLDSRSDVQHGATWLKGNVPAQGSTAYLFLGRLGQGGTATLRFVVRYQGPRAADLSNCTVTVDGAEVGTFSLTPNRADQPGDGSVVQLSDTHFDDARPAVLAMVSGQSAIVRTADGKEIRLDRAELDEMRRVLSAYLHLQAQP